MRGLIIVFLPTYIANSMIAHVDAAVYGVLLLTLGAHAQEGYCSCLVCTCVCVCLSVCYNSSGNTARFYAQRKVHRGLFSDFYLWIFDKTLFRNYGVKKPICK